MGYQSAAAQFVERSDPPKIRVVVRKRPLNQKVQQMDLDGASHVYLPLQSAAALCFFRFTFFEVYSSKVRATHLCSTHHARRQ